ncbi:hypothetical protein CR513_40714, partial [Mucuna pruriens]
MTRYDVVSYLSPTPTLNQVGSNNGVDRRVDRKMEQSKSRSDLLLAGKKKLQQFRQKKDSKGGSSRGKSSKQGGKPQLPDSDSDATSRTSVSTVSSQITDGNVEADINYNVVNTESSESQSVANSLALSPDQIDPSVDSSSMVTAYDTGNETVLDSNAELAHQVHGVRENDSELSAQDQGEIAQDIGADVLENVSLRTSYSLVPEGGATYDHAFAPVTILSPPASVTTAVGESVTDKRDSDKREELLVLSEDISNTSVMQTREDQVLGYYMGRLGKLIHGFDL